MKNKTKSLLYISIYLLYIVVLATMLTAGKGLQAWDVSQKLALLATIYILLGITIAVRVLLCISFPTKAQRIAMPAVFATISTAISLWLFFNSYGSYKYFWTLAAADIASVFIGLAKKQ